MFTKAVTLSRRFENVLLLCLIVAIFVGLIAWAAVTAPNVSALPPSHKRMDHWG
jgi:hypothetical protein